MSTSRHVKFHKCGFHKCGIISLLSYAIDPSNVFGYRRLEYHKYIQYDERTSSKGSEVDASKAAKARREWHYDFAPHAKGPTVKPATVVTPSVSPELLVTAIPTIKPTTTPGMTPRSFTTSTVSQRPESEAKASGILISMKGSPMVAKASLAKGTLEKATAKSVIVPLPWLPVQYFQS